MAAESVADQTALAPRLRKPVVDTAGRIVDGIFTLHAQRSNLIRKG